MRAELKQRGLKDVPTVKLIELLDVLTTKLQGEAYDWPFKSKLVVEMAQADPEYKQDIKDEVDKIKVQIADNEALISQSGELQEDLVDFVKFGLEYTNTLIDDYWKLDHEERVRCQQLILPGGISFNHNKKVSTPEISSIYTLEPNKKDLRFSRKSLMVELAGTAPASAGLSWLVFYRLSSLYDLRSGIKMNEHSERAILSLANTTDRSVGASRRYETPVNYLKSC